MTKGTPVNWLTFIQLFDLHSEAERVDGRSVSLIFYQKMLPLCKYTAAKIESRVDVDCPWQ